MKRIASVLLLGVLLLGSIPAAADKGKESASLADILHVKLLQTPAFGEINEIRLYRAILYPQSDRVLCQMVREHNGTVLTENAFHVRMAEMAPLISAVESFHSVEASVDTGVIDGYYTIFAATLASGGTIHCGSLVAEKYGPDGFRFAYTMPS